VKFAFIVRERVEYEPLSVELNSFKDMDEIQAYNKGIE